MAINVFNRLISQLQRGSIRRNAAQILFVQVITIGLSLGVNVIIGRYLNPAEKGVLDLFRLLVSLVGIFGMFGIGSGLFYFYTNKGVSFDQVHSTGLVYIVIAGSITLFIGVLGVNLWQDVFEGLVPWVVIAGFAVAPFIYYRSIWALLTVGYGKPLLNFLMTLGITAINLLIVLALVITRTMTAEILVIVTILLTIIPAVLGFIYFMRRNIVFSPSINLFNNSFQYGLIIYIGSIANFLHFRVDQLMISNLLDLRAVGLYAVSIRFAEMILLLDTPISTAALKRISSASSSQSSELTRKIGLVQFAISGSIAIGVALLAPYIIGLYGPAYEDSVLPLIFLLPGIVAWSASRVLSQYISYNRGKVWYPTIFSVFGLSINIAVNMLLIPTYGIIGVAVASSISYSIVMLLTLATFLLLKDT